MAIPSFISGGTIAADWSGAVSVTPNIPTHVADDILIVICTNADGADMTTTTPGWVEIAEIAGTDTFNWFWKRATEAGTAGPTITASSGDGFCVGYVIRGCITTETPFEDATTAGDGSTSETTPDTALITTTDTDRLGVCTVSWSDDTGYTAPPPPVGWVQEHDTNTSSGTDNQFTLISIEKATAGDISAVVIGTTATSAYWGSLTLAFIPPDSGEKTASVSPVVINLSQPEITASYIEVHSATTTPVATTLTPTTTTATYIQVESVSVTPVIVNVTIPAVTATGDASFPTGWTLLGTYTVDNTKVAGSSNITDLPVLLDENAFHSDVFDNCDNGGGDLRLSSDEAGSNQLALHVVEFNTTADTAVCWTLPTLDYNDDTVIYIWGDNTSETQPAANSTYGSEAVYPAMFEGVYNYEDTPNDATDNDAHGTEVGGIGYVASKIGKAIDPLGFDNTDKLTFSTDWNLGTASLSVLQWINLDSVEEQGLFFCYGKTNGGGVSFGVGEGSFNDASGSTWDGNEFIALKNDKSWFDSNLEYGTGDVQMIFQLNSSGQVRAYKDGSIWSETDASAAPDASENEGYHGGYRQTTYEYEVDAEISLTWVINSEIGADWAATAHNNQNDVSDFGTAAGVSGGDEAAVVPVVIEANIPAVTATSVSVRVATVAAVALTAVVTALAATYIQINTAAVSPVAMNVTQPAVTASHLVSATATVSPVSMVLTQPAVTATSVSIRTATVAPVSMNLTTVAVTATYIQVGTATVSPVVLNITQPVVTASSDSSETATVSPVGLTLAQPTVTATYIQIETSSVSPVSLIITQPGTTALYTQIETATVSAVGLTIAPPAVTATHLSVQTAAVSPLIIEITPPPVSATYLSVLSAAVVPLTTELNVTTLTATYEGEAIPTKITYDPLIDEVLYHTHAWHVAVTDLNSLSAGKGAELVGSKDVGAFYTDSTVEEILQEIGQRLYDLENP